MPEQCSGCRLKYERAPGYFLGAAYINYGVTAVLLLIVYPMLHYGFALSNKDLAPWLAGLVVAFPLFAFRYARALWLALDCQVEGTLERQPDGIQFTAFAVQATLTVPQGTDEARARKLLEKAEHSCLITNSLKAPASLEAQIRHP